MTYNPTNADLYNLIQRLCGKIENLERKIEKITKKGEFDVEKHRKNLGLGIPVLFEEWIPTFEINYELYNNIFELGGGILFAFKQMLVYNIDAENTYCSIFQCKKNIYVYTLVDNTPEWCLFNDENLRVIIQEIWRKTLMFQLDHLGDNDDDEDIKRKIVLQMRQNLFDVKKTRQEINQWLCKVV